MGDNQIKENLKFSVEIVSGSLYKFVLFIDIFLLLPALFLTSAKYCLAYSIPSDDVLRSAFCCHRVRILS